TSTRGNSLKRAARTKRRSSSIRTTGKFARTSIYSRKSMTASAKSKTSRRLVVGGLTMLVSAFAVACGPSFFEIPLETPLQPKLDVSPFQRVLVAGFVVGGTDALDTNQETVRLLRSQLRTK